MNSCAGDIFCECCHCHCHRHDAALPSIAPAMNTHTSLVNRSPHADSTLCKQSEDHVLWDPFFVSGMCGFGSRSKHGAKWPCQTFATSDAAMGLLRELCVRRKHLWRVGWFSLVGPLRCEELCPRMGDASRALVRVTSRTRYRTRLVHKTRCAASDTSIPRSSA